jgi:hypothetical protein
MSYAPPISTEYWEDNGSPTYQMLTRIEREGIVLEG